MTNHGFLPTLFSYLCSHSKACIMNNSLSYAPIFSDIQWSSQASTSLWSNIEKNQHFLSHLLTRVYVISDLGEDQGTHRCKAGTNENLYPMGHIQNFVGLTWRGQKMPKTIKKKQTDPWKGESNPFLRLTAEFVMAGGLLK